MARPKKFTEEEITQRKKEQNHASFMKWYDKEENKAYSRNFNKRKYYIRYLGEERVNQIIEENNGDLDKAVPYLKLHKSLLRKNSSEVDPKL